MPKWKVSVRGTGGRPLGEGRGMYTSTKSFAGTGDYDDFSGLAVRRA
jgi:hypothetical protein